MPLVPPKRIVVATDFSDTAGHALEYGVALARAIGAEIVLVHAYEAPTYAFPDGAMMAGDLLQRLQAASQEALDAAVRAQASSGVPVRGKLRMGTPWREIVAMADDERADMIAIGTHGRRGVAHLLLGSVAERVVRASTVPVLTVGPLR